MQVLHITNIIFGKEYTETFLYTLPSQLENFKYLKNKAWPALYRIYTTDEDKKNIQKSEIFSQISSLVKIEFVKIRKLKKRVHDTMTACHNDIISYANKKKAVIVFLLPDLLLSNNVFEKICTCLSRGKRVLVGTALRLRKEDIFQANRASEFINIKPRDLVKKALPYLHKMNYAFFWDYGPKIWAWAALLCWYLDKNNILIRGFHLHPIFVWPKKTRILCRGTFDNEFINYSCPDKTDWEVLENSDEAVLFELSSVKRFYGGLFSHKKIKTAYNFAHTNLYRCHLHFVQSKIYILSSGYKDSDQWKKTEKKSDKIINVISKKYNNLFYRKYIWPLKEKKIKYYYPIRNKYIELTGPIKNFILTKLSKLFFLLRTIFSLLKTRNISFVLKDYIKKKYPNFYCKTRKIKLKCLHKKTKN